ncbi:methyltransferase domain-containing protein [Prosthecomicrobium sp. N25]|uniref:methyltransferase domain-containing protein n=1 Tax=Prosthecomicrobium sp. N25 TaxID=3129254 RepID=UPI003076DFC1
MVVDYTAITDILACPRCRTKLARDATSTLRCDNPDCEQHGRPFQVLQGVPILVDFRESVLDEEVFFRHAAGSDLPRDPSQQTVSSRAKRFLFGTNQSAERISVEMVRALGARTARPRILVVGGGEIGSGARALYAAAEVDLVGTDIYASANTTLVADGHQLPFLDGAFDGVWIQAVLEHVLDPQTVVAEIHRVLKPGGLVFADTPFMQPVHEGPYDFCRFSLSGHRWLFRRFTLIDAGYTGGPGTSARWLLGYLARALTRSSGAGRAVAAAFFWLRFFDLLAPGRFAADAASGTYFYGERSEQSIRPADAIRFYEEQKALTARKG